MINLLNMDCMEFMASKPGKYYELAIVDPPYGINAPQMAATPYQSKNGTKRLNGGSGKMKYRILNTSNITWDNEIPFQEYFNELRRVSNNQIIWGGNYYNLGRTRGFVVWDKEQPFTNFSAVEFAWTSFNCPSKIYREATTRTGEEKIHPTQKSVKLYKYLLTNYAKQGDKILDTHGGSMSIALACHDLGFDLDCTELDKDYYDKAIERYNTHISQLRIDL